jgi:uncharacterized protein YecE (DUF72 family)
MLEFYCQHFRTVELNCTFYRLPAPGMAERWNESTPDDFCFAVKGSRFLTHMKKLKDPEAGITRFFEPLAGLGSKLGPILFQLPPFWDADPVRLEAFLTMLPSGHRYAFELRNPTWHNPEIQDILRRHNAAFCIFEIAGFRSPLDLTADFTYIRLHGPGGAYQGSYSTADLSRWAGQIQEWKSELKGVYIYFDNDQMAYAAHNALSLECLLQKS